MATIKTNPPDLPRSPQWEKAKALAEAWFWVNEESSDAGYAACSYDTLDDLIRRIEEALYEETHR